MPQRRNRLQSLAIAAIKIQNSTAVSMVISKTFARSTWMVQQKTIHNFLCSTVSSKTQNDQFSSEILKRVESILSCHHSDAFLSDYGYIYEWFWKTKHRFWFTICSSCIWRKVSVLKKMYFAMLILLEHHVKSKANQLKNLTIYNLSLIKY